MVALRLFDSILADDATTERSRRIAGQVVQMALSDLAQIEKLDEGLAPEDPSQFDRRTAKLLRDEYERWAREAGSLLDRIDRFQLHGGPVADAESLRRAHGKTLVRLSISIDDMEQSLRALAEGRLVPIEEVRRGLRIRVH
jgi:hypothetical protein